MTSLAAPRTLWRRASRPLLAAAICVLTAALRDAPVGPTPREGATHARVRLGIEVLLTDSLDLVRGKRVGLITNQTSVTPDGRSTIDLLFHAPGVRLTALFAPEHGLRGQGAAGERIESGTDSATGVPVYSLYGETRVPTPEMLRNVDVLVYDIQDVGARVYTFEWTMALAAQAGKRKFIVLDRPNPIRGDRVEGGVLDTAFRSFVGQYPVAMRYGLTPGELLRYLVGTGQVDADVTVVPMQGWHRAMWWEETGLPWHNPSPNIRSVDAALVYSGTVFFEGTNLSEGRGTAFPFQLVGAGWLGDAGAIARELNGKRIPGVVFDSSVVTVEEGQKWGGQRIPMLVVSVADRTALRPHQVGLEMLRAIYRRHPREFQWNRAAIDRLAGSDRVRKAVETDGGIEALIPLLDAESREFADSVRPYLLYP